MRHSVSRVIAGSAVASLVLVGLMVAATLGGTRSAQAGPGTVIHRVQHDFTLSPGGARTFTLPVTDTFVHVDVVDLPTNHGTQTPSELMSAVIDYDSGSDQFTWIGTNSDGSQAAGNSLGANVSSATRIAVICGGPCPLVWNAALDVQDPTTATLVFSQNANTTSITGHYVLTFWWFS